MLKRREPEGKEFYRGGGFRRARTISEEFPDGPLTAGRSVRQDTPHRLKCRRESATSFKAAVPGWAGYDIRTVQELMGHSGVETTMVNAHVLSRSGRGVRSPLDEED